MIDAAFGKCVAITMRPTHSKKSDFRTTSKFGTAEQVLRPVIPAKAGIHFRVLAWDIAVSVLIKSKVKLDSRFRGNDDS